MIRFSSKQTKARKKFHRRLFAQHLEERRLLAVGPYSPPAEQTGSLALKSDSSAIVGWASGWEDYLPGLEVDAEFQHPSRALGEAQGDVFDAVTLGRGGQITLKFDAPIRDGLGADFAVFENSFSDTFLELAYVEVSSDGANFFRFPNDSKTDLPVSSFGSIDATNIRGFAGKYRQGFGVPFDISDLGEGGAALDRDSITHVRIVDVIGDGSQLDSSGDPIYDPYPTVGSAGLDLDAVAVINQSAVGIESVDFEDIGENLAAQSHWNGPVIDGEIVDGPFNQKVTVGTFSSSGATLNNSHVVDNGVWSQFGYSNRTDTTTAGFTNQFSAFAGIGALESQTYGVVFVDPSSTGLPTISVPNDAGSLSSVRVTNTTYAALSMRDGDSFAKKFGGDSGNDPDFFRLTIEGKSTAGTSVGTVVTYLADYRATDNSLDYIVQDWKTVDLSPIEKADLLEFSLASSDVGTFGMNTPAYFAIDELAWNTPGIALDLLDYEIAEDAGASATRVRVSRSSNDVAEPMTVAIASTNNKVVLPETVTISMGESFVEFDLGVEGNETVDGNLNATITATSGDLTASRSLTVLDDDLPRLLITLSDTEIDEGDSVMVTVSRENAVNRNAIDVDLASSLPSIVAAPSTVTIPAGSDSVDLTIRAIEDEINQPITSASIFVSATGYTPTSQIVSVKDNDQPSLVVTSTKLLYSESDGSAMIDFEDVGSRLPIESFNNGSDGNGSFTSNGLVFNNDFNSDFGSWSGWAYSNTTDSETVGFQNQYSVYSSSSHSSGANGSSTYAVASAYGANPPRMTRDVNDGSGFKDLAINNTTYAALSMLQGDAFAKKFGGEDGTDPDFFLLTIEGFDADESSTGIVEYYLADYRFEDDSLDYIVDSWTTVDVSSLGEATSLSFSLSSSDVGDFGMNTPAYFAIDDIVLLQAESQGPTISISRRKASLDSPLSVSLRSDSPEAISVPERITIDSGQSSIVVPIGIRDDDFFSDDRNVNITATALGLASDDLTLSLTDNDEPRLTLTFLQSELSESDARPRAGFEDIGLVLPSDSFHNGSSWSGQFESSDFYFNNEFNPEFGSWAGWSISNVTDTETQGFGNQYSAFTGSGADGSSTYAVGNAFPGAFVPEISRNDNASSARFESIMITNSTYAALSMKNGDAFAKKFGGEDGNDPDFLLLTIIGLDASGESIGEVPFYLADYRFIDNSRDYLVDQWTRVDISSIGEAQRLAFSLSSSDNGQFGMNTPAYFAIDDVRTSIEGAAVQNVLVHRNDLDLSGPLMAEVSSGSTRLTHPSQVTIPAGMSSSVFSVSVLDDSYVQVDEVLSLTVDADEYLSESVLISVVDDDELELTATIDQSTLSETTAQDASVRISRNSDDLSEALRIDVAPSVSNALAISDSIVIPAGRRDVSFSVSAIDNSTIEGTKSVALSFSADEYAATEIALQIEDDDSAGISVSPLNQPAHVSELGGTDLLAIRLSAEPSSDVVVTLQVRSENQVELSSDELQFTPQDWDDAQIVSVSAIADFLIEPTQQVVVSIGVDSDRSDSAFVDVDVVNVDVSIEDHRFDSLELTSIGESPETQRVVFRDTSSNREFSLLETENGLFASTSVEAESLDVRSSVKLTEETTISLLAGDDVVTIASFDRLNVDGGDGEDRLRIIASGDAVALGRFLSEQVSGFEQIEVLGSSETAMLIETPGMSAEAKALPLLDLGNRRVDVDSEWTLAESRMVDERFAQILKFENTELPIVTNRPYQNVRKHWDVNNSGKTTTSDALAVINRLQFQAGALPAEVADVSLFDGNYIDVSGDGRVTAFDAVLVINRLPFELTDDASEQGESEQILTDQARELYWFQAYSPSQHLSRDAQGIRAIQDSSILDDTHHLSHDDFSDDSSATNVVRDAALSLTEQWVSNSDVGGSLELLQDDKTEWWRR